MPGFREVRRYKLIQLQRIAGSEEQVIEITDLLKETLNVALIREIECVVLRKKVDATSRSNSFEPTLNCCRKDRTSIMNQESLDVISREDAFSKPLQGPGYYSPNSFFAGHD